MGSRFALLSYDASPSTGTRTAHEEFVQKDGSIVVWHPGPYKLWPKRIKNKIGFLSLWLLHVIDPRISLRDYRAYLVYENDTLVHHTVLLRRSFKYPFMGENDYQVGLVYTARHYRRRNVAVHTLRSIVSQAGNSAAKIWYLTNVKNVPSIKLALKAGFTEAGAVRRSAKFFIGIYHFALQGRDQQSGPNPDYSVLTERPGLGATEEQIERIYQRYCFSREFADGKDVLEVACGSGMGLRFLAETGNRVVGVDIDKKNVEEAASLRNGADNNNSKREINLAVMDAHSLSFQDGSFDVVLILESIYYLAKPLEFVREAARVLRKGGVLIVATVNKDWSAFHPSPYSCRYFSAPELYEMLKGCFVDISLYGGFPTLAPGLKAQAVQCMKQIAVKLNLIPRTLKGRELLKRIFLGKVRSVPHGIVEGMVKYERPTPVPHDGPNIDSKILYVFAKKEA